MSNDFSSKDKSTLSQIFLNPFLLAGICIAVFVISLITILGSKNRARTKNADVIANSNTTDSTESKPAVALSANALDSAKKINTVGSYRSVINTYPGSSEAEQARAEIDNLYKINIENFKSDMATAPRRAQILPFMDDLVAYLQSEEQNVIEIRYIKHAGNDEYMQHEPMIDTMSNIVSAWERCFSAFDKETIQIQEGNPIEKSELAGITKPTIVLKYFDDINYDTFKATDGTEVGGTDVSLKFTLMVPDNGKKLDIAVMGRTYPGSFQGDPYTASEALAVEKAVEALLKQFGKRS